MSTMKKLLAILAVFAITIAVSECKRHQNQAKGRRRGRLGGASPGASAADCAKFLDIKVYADSPGYHRFKPDAKACKAGPSYVGSTEDGNCHVTLVPSGGGGGGSGGDAAGAFAASVTCDDTGAVYSIGQDGNGTMTVVERLQEDYGPELDPPDDDETPPEERALLLEARPPPAAPDAPPPAGGPRGGVVAGGDRSSPAENIGDHRVHRDLQVNVDIDVLVIYTAHAECRNAGRARGCQRDATTRNSILGLIDLAVAETNTAYSLSGVKVELNLVHAAFDTYVEASTNAYNVALTDLRTNNDGKLDQAHALRTTYGADVVALIIDDSQYCGIAYLGPSINYMFSVTSWNCATGYYSFGHEIGHNFVSSVVRPCVKSLTLLNILLLSLRVCFPFSLFVFLGRDAIMTGVHRMHAAAPLTTTDSATQMAHSVPSSPTPAKLTSAMATEVAAAPESKGSPTITMATICTMGKPSETQRIITRGG